MQKGKKDHLGGKFSYPRIFHLLFAAKAKRPNSVGPALLARGVCDPEEVNTRNTAKRPYNEGKREQIIKPFYYSTNKFEYQFTPLGEGDLKKIDFSSLEQICSIKTEKEGRLFWNITLQTNEGAYKFQISWKRDLGEDQAKSVCETLWLTFEVALNTSFDPMEYFPGLDSCFELESYNGSQSFKFQKESAKKKLSEAIFEPLWSEFRNSTHSEDCSEWRSDEPTEV
eukprot:GHVP01039765.1.p1 GENE.GHVP01039765.1~~GHVP01039765.1.p1  ORF type:complete len:226 (+),score=28.56 GHVP01039765.1:129-806(+)